MEKRYWQNRYGMIWEFLVFPEYVEVSFDYCFQQKDGKTFKCKGANYLRHSIDNAEDGCYSLIDPEGGPYIAIGEHCPTVANSKVTKIQFDFDKQVYIISYSIEKEQDVKN